MSEYTPTTEQVRLAGRDRHANRISGPAFDRWLAAHDAEVRAAGIEAAAVIADRYATAPGRPRASVESIAARDIAARIRGDAEERAGVVAEEQDWEYRTLLDGVDPQPHGRLSRGEITPDEWFAARQDDRDLSLERRTPPVPAGPWVPVEQGDDDA